MSERAAQLEALKRKKRDNKEERERVLRDLEEARPYARPPPQPAPGASRPPPLAVRPPPRAG